MTKTDISSLAKAYVNVKPSVLLTEMYAPEGITIPPVVIKVKEKYIGGPHSGETDVMYRIINRAGNTVKAVCEHDPNLTMQITIDDPDVQTEGDAYVVTAEFKWDNKRKTYHPIDDTQLPEENPLKSLAAAGIQGAHKFIDEED